MNDQDKIAEQAAEIANLHKALAERKAKIAELMGEAARAGIAGALVRGAGEVPRLIELLNVIKPNFGDVGSRDVEVRAQRERIEAAIAILSAAPAAPLPEQTGPSVGDDPEFIGRVIAAASAVMDGDTSGEWQRFAAYIDSRLAATPSPAPTQQQEPQWISVADRLPPNDSGFVLVTNNLMAENAFGTMSHLWLALMIHPQDDGTFAAFAHPTTSRVESITHWRDIASKELADSDCVSVPVKSLILAVITLAHASSGNTLYDEAYNELSRIIKAHRMSKESVETAAPGASTGDKQ